MIALHAMWSRDHENRCKTAEARVHDYDALTSIDVNLVDARWTSPPVLDNAARLGMSDRVTCLEECPSPEACVPEPVRPQAEVCSLGERTWRRWAMGAKSLTL